MPGVLTYVCLNYVGDSSTGPKPTRNRTSRHSTESLPLLWRQNDVTFEKLFGTASQIQVFFEDKKTRAYNVNVA